ncbi:TraR/DksA family transcriptional regulator [Patescibacteria group bacterium]
MDTNHYKNKLEEEKSKLELELSKIATPNPQNPDDWETKPEELNVMIADRNELADVFEESANKEALEKELENRLNRIKAALKRIEDKTYGVCEVEGCPIEKKRLEVNPEATTCIKHAGQTGRI